MDQKASGAKPASMEKQAQFVGSFQMTAEKCTFEGSASSSQKYISSFLAFGADNCLNCKPAKFCVSSPMQTQNHASCNNVLSYEVLNGIINFLESSNIEEETRLVERRDENIPSTELKPGSSTT
jgi:hypothetical protein